MRAPLWEFTGVIEAPPDRVAALMAVRPGPVGPDNLWLMSDSLPGGVVSGGPGRFRVSLPSLPSRAMTIEADDGFVAAQGGWWYRGEYRLEPHPEGSRLVHRVFNVARRGRWAVPMANRFFIGFEARGRTGMSGLLARVGERLGCGTRLE
ncbi:hypothetical protein Ssi03_26890 [Sphaerisporangium siamense]|uniref:SRPBCC family protein n=1 Tax=Sphaerisporangium siamense TaxID=795645 RepID=A0A7W7G879_9ACTN|nr:hypothetical protein [Sphaerisporangium siamense]MBB4699982.1 hypothetical protein [Sphaerisporangium siamense]GII84699.1 hypothetical protein Ssi03_26890 [Sphaerisporangium siamense]